MTKLLVILVAVVVIVWLLRRAIAGSRKTDADAPARGDGGDDAGALVSCAHCGVNLPKGEARSAGGHHYCSEEHWRLGPRKP